MVISLLLSHKENNYMMTHVLHWLGSITSHLDLKYTVTNEHLWKREEKEIPICRLNKKSCELKGQTSNV